jgi:hypothetical protein
MTNHHMNRATRDLAVEQSLDAAIEIDQMIRGDRTESPMLSKLVKSLIGSGREPGSTKRDLLKDSQFSSLYHRATMSTGRGPDVEDEDTVLTLLLLVDRAGLSNFSPDQLSLIRDFCLGLNRELVSESYNRTPEPQLSRSRQAKFVLAHGH